MLRGTNNVLYSPYDGFWVPNWGEKIPHSFADILWHLFRLKSATIEWVAMQTLTIRIRFLSKKQVVDTCDCLSQVMYYLVCHSNFECIHILNTYFILTFQIVNASNVIENVSHIKHNILSLNLKVINILCVNFQSCIIFLPKPLFFISVWWKNFWSQEGSVLLNHSFEGITHSFGVKSFNFLG